MGGTPNNPASSSEDQAALDRKRELDINEREVAVKEREASAHADELKRTRWLNPTVIGLLVAALGLIGSVVVARVNNSNTQEVQRLQSEANVTLEAIKTGTGNTDAACKNLVFFVSLGLIRDAEGKIANQCANAPTGPPSLPANQPTTRQSNPKIIGVVTESGTRKAIEGVYIGADEFGLSVRTSIEGTFELDLPSSAARGSAVQLIVTKRGYIPMRENVVISEEPNMLVLQRSEGR